MLIRFYKSPQPAALFSVPVVAAVFTIGAFFCNPEFASQPNFGFPFFDWISGIHFFSLKIITALISWILISWQAIYFNKIITKYEVLYKPSTLPAFIYVCTIGVMPNFIGLHPALFVSTIMLFLIDRIFRLYKNDSPLALVFDSGFLISIASLFYFPALGFAVFYFISLRILRPFNWREWIVSLMGIFTPWFLIFLIYYLSGNQDLLLKNFSPEKIKPVLLIQFHFDKTIYVAAISSGALLLFSLFKLRANFYKNVIRMRNFQWVFLFCLVISVGVAFISNEKILFPFSLLAVPLSVFISYYFLTLKKTWYFESLFILWAVSIIYCYVSHS